jgi:outer membrane protein assembly factor BamA
VELFIYPHKRKIDALYVLHPGQPYFINDYSTDIQDSVIARLIALRKPLLYNGLQFSTDALNTERSQLTTFLQDQGYFRFHKEFITYRAHKDTARHEVGLTMVLHPYRANSEAKDTLHSRYWIRNISYESGALNDSAIHLRPSVLKENTFLTSGQPYSSTQLQNTYNRFGRLGAVRYTNISFQPVADTTLLDTKIQIQTNKPSTISFQPEGTNTSGDLGAAISLTYQNRNIFHGSETFTMKVRGAYEAIRGLEGYSNQDFIEYSIEGRLTFPRFIVPFLSAESRKRNNATSEVFVMYDSQDRPEFHRRVLSAGWGYQWRKQNRPVSYRFDVLDLNYVFMPWISETFRKEYLDNTTNSNVILRYNYEDLFIMKMGFGYTYNNGRLALKTNIETAGNLLGLGTAIFGGSKNSNGQYKVFDIAYAHGAYAVYISGAGPTIMAIADEENTYFAGKMRFSLDNAGLTGWAVHDLKIDNVGAADRR